jgi:hypothetical protein
MTKKQNLLKKHPDWKAYLPHIAYDSVVFGFSGEKLKILVMEYHNTGFCLTGWVCATYRKSE